jgi:ABC-type multidrug transport system fused ATPase/permease subunit
VPHSDVDPPDLSFLPTIRRLAVLWREQWLYVAIGVFSAFVTVGLSIWITKLIQQAVDEAIVPDQPEKLKPIVLLILGLAVARFLFNFLRRWSTSQIGIRIEARIRGLMYDAYLRYPRRFYDRHSTGQVLSRATNDLYPIRYFIGWGVVQTIQSVMMIVGTAIVLAAVNPVLAVVAGLVMPLIALLTWRFARLVIPISREAQQKVADVTEAADEGVVGIEMVQAFGREPDVRDRFAGKASAVRDVVLREAKVEGRYLPGLTFLPSLAIALVLLVGGHYVINGTLTFGEFVLFNSLLLQLVWPLEALGWILNLAQRAIASASRSFAWLDGIHPLAEPTASAPLPAGPVPVRFAGVRFGYGDGDEVVRGLDLDIAAGEIVAVCGSTGSGKTTLLSLLPRFYDVDDGRVTIGGVDVRDLRLVDLRSTVGLVTQRAVLFSVTLRENLVAARPDAPWEDVLAACEAAGVTAFVDELPDGYDTLIGERGVNLSGGQRQRVALARVLLSTARVLVLDDPLSAVDTETERELVANLRPAVAGRTVLVATQRLSTVRAADRAVVMRAGLIVEQGRPDDLLTAGGPFAHLFAEELADVR